MLEDENEDEDAEGQEQEQGVQVEVEEGGNVPLPLLPDHSPPQRRISISNGSGYEVPIK